MERLVRFLLTKDAIEASFKLLSYLGTSALLLGLAKFSSSNEGWYAGLPFVFIFLVTVIQSFFYGLQTLIFPAGNALWPTVNYSDTISALQNFNNAQRANVLKNIFTTKPALFLLVSYVVLFYILNGILKVLIEKALHA